MILFASDMDGTLLNADFSISQENLDAIGRLEQHGIRFVIATGRCYVDAAYILARGGLRCPVVCSNGAAVRAADGRLLAKQTIPLSELRRVCAYMDQNHIFYGINSSQSLSLLRDWDTALDSTEQGDPTELARLKEIVLSQHGLCYLESFDSFLNGKCDSCSLSIMSTDPEKLRLLWEFAALSGQLCLTESGFGSMEITVAGCSKASGLELLENVLGVIGGYAAIGDSYNDAEMLQAARFSFAVGNAPRQIKDLCTYITPPCGEHGVAYAIDLLLTNNRLL